MKARALPRFGMPMAIALSVIGIGFARVGQSLKGSSAQTREPSNQVLPKSDGPKVRKAVLQALERRGIRFRFRLPVTVAGSELRDFELVFPSVASEFGTSPWLLELIYAANGKDRIVLLVAAPSDRHDAFANLNRSRNNGGLRKARSFVVLTDPPAKDVAMDRILDVDVGVIVKRGDGPTARRILAIVDRLAGGANSSESDFDALIRLEGREFEDFVVSRRNGLTYHRAKQWFAAASFRRLDESGDGNPYPDRIVKLLAFSDPRLAVRLGTAALRTEPADTLGFRLIDLACRESGASKRVSKEDLLPATAALLVLWRDRESASTGEIGRNPDAIVRIFLRFGDSPAAATEFLRSCRVVLPNDLRLAMESQAGAAKRK
ncbi:MAG: hypothetical protein KIS66_06925 [Fimbriimonadaceae bacterium]|nr:hypothetical protein [Fimbriimonadaceae bacterium]